MVAIQPFFRTLSTTFFASSMASLSSSLQNLFSLSQHHCLCSADQSASWPNSKLDDTQSLNQSFSTSAQGIPWCFYSRWIYWNFFLPSCTWVEMGNLTVKGDATNLFVVTTPEVEGQPIEGQVFFFRSKFFGRKSKSQIPKSVPRCRLHYKTCYPRNHFCLSSLQRSLLAPCHHVVEKWCFFCWQLSVHVGRMKNKKNTTSVPANCRSTALSPSTSQDSSRIPKSSTYQPFSTNLPNQKKDPLPKPFIPFSARQPPHGKRPTTFIPNPNLAAKKRHLLSTGNRNDHRLCSYEYNNNLASPWTTRLPNLGRKLEENPLAEPFQILMRAWVTGILKKIAKYSW